MRLRELRSESGLNQNDIASKLGVSGQTILNWENGIYEPKISQLIQLAGLFNVTVDYLIERENVPSQADIVCEELEKINKEDLNTNQLFTNAILYLGGILYARFLKMDGW